MGSPLPARPVHPHAALSHDSNGWFSTSAFSHLPHLYEPPACEHQCLGACLSSLLSVFLSFCVAPPFALRTEQSFINVPGWFLAVSAASDVHQLQLVKKHSLFPVICPVPYPTDFISHQTHLPLFPSSNTSLLIITNAENMQSLFLLYYLILVLPVFAAPLGLCVRSRIGPAATVV